MANQSDEHWADIECQIREAIRQLPDANEFTNDEIGRMVLRTKRVHRDAYEAIAAGEEAYDILIAEIVSLMVENARLVRLIEGRQKPPETYDGWEPDD